MRYEIFPPTITCFDLVTILKHSTTKKTKMICQQNWIDNIFFEKKIDFKSIYAQLDCFALLSQSNYQPYQMVLSNIIVLEFDVKF